MSADVREEILDGLAVLLGEGAFEKFFGHISARIPNRDALCMMGHVHDGDRTLAELTADDLIVIDADGRVLEGGLEPPGEYHIHTEIYRRRPDVGSVIHCHPRAAVALSISRTDVIPVTWRSGIFHPRIPRFDDPSQIDTREKGAAMAELLGAGRAVTLTGHGVVCVGETVAQATVVTLDLEDAAQFMLTAMAAGGAHPLPDEQIAHRAATPPDAEGFTAAWNYYRARWRREVNA